MPLFYAQIIFLIKSFDWLRTELGYSAPIIHLSDFTPPDYPSANLTFSKQTKRIAYTFKIQYRDSLSFMLDIHGWVLGWLTHLFHYDSGKDGRIESFYRKVLVRSNYEEVITDCANYCRQQLIHELTGHTLQMSSVSKWKGEIIRRNAGESPVPKMETFVADKELRLADKILIELLKGYRTVYVIIRKLVRDRVRPRVILGRFDQTTEVPLVVSIDFKTHKAAFYCCYKYYENDFVITIERRLDGFARNDEQTYNIIDLTSAIGGLDWRQLYSTIDETNYEQIIDMHYEYLKLHLWDIIVNDDRWSVKATGS